MKILVLHGFGQSTEIVQKRGKDLFKHLKKLGHQLIISEGDIKVQLFDQDGSIRQEGRAWFAYNSDDPNKFLEEMNRDETEWFEIANTLERLKSIDFDAILGFSQGGAVALAMAMKFHSDLKDKKIIVMSGFMKPAPTNLELRKIDNSVLMLWDPEENIVAKESLLSVKSWCNNLKEITHNKRHSIPSVKIVRDKICEFLE